MDLPSKRVPLLAIIVLIGLPHLSVGETTCISNPNVVNDKTNPTQDFFNSCRRDTNHIPIQYGLAGQIWQWFNGDAYAQYVLLILVLLPYLVGFGNEKDSTLIDPEMSARAHRIRVQMVLLLFRIALSNSMNPWLYTVFRQERPCYCHDSDTQTFKELGTIWGMPSGDVQVATIVALHLMEWCNIPLGVLLVLGVGYERVVLGLHSLGQVLGGVASGIVIHFYTTRTPVFVRLLDVVVNAVVGSILLVISKEHYPGDDFSFAVGFFSGLVWQVAAIMLLFVYYQWRFLVNILRKTAASVRELDFLYYLPLNKQATLLASQRKFEGWLVLLVVLFLFAGIAVFRVATPFIGSWLEGGTGS